MIRKTTITVTQLFVMIFLSRMIMSLTYNPLMVSGNNMWDNVISIFISFVVMLILLIPVYLLYKKDPKMTIADNSVNYLGRFGVVIVLIYSVYYLFVCCYSLSSFNIFISNVMNPSLSVKTISIAISLTSCYGAYKGLEGLARASSIIMFIIFVAIIFLAVALIPKIDPLNYTPFLYNDSGETVNAAFMTVSKMSSIAAMAMLLPFAKGNIKSGIITWNIVLHISMVLIVTVLVGSLGEYLKAHVFPVYAATSVAEIGMFKRLDSLYLGIFITGIFVKISLFIFLLSLTITKILNEKAGKISIIISGLIISIVGMIFSNTKSTEQFFYSTPFLLVFTLITGFFIPIFLLLVINKKTRKDERVEKKCS